MNRFIFFPTAFVFFLLILASNTAVQAQDFEINRYDIAATLRTAANSADIQATLHLTNQSAQGNAAKTLLVRISKEAKVTAVTLNGAVATFKQDADPRLPALTIVSADLFPAVAPGGKLDAQIRYTLTVKESTQYAALTPGDALLLPEGFWIPVVHTPLQPHGADTAPYTLTVTSSEEGEVLSDGERQANGNTTTFTSTLSTQPWLLVSSWEKPLTRNMAPPGGAAVTLSVSAQPGLAGADAQARRIMDEVEKIVGFYAQTLGAPPARQLAVVSTPRNVIFGTPTTLVVGESVFRRDALDAETTEFLARWVARQWFGGKFRLRGKGLGIVQDALPSYLAALYFESRYGVAGARQYWARRVRGYAPLSMERKDPMLVAQTPLDADYFTSMLNKGALVFRLVEKQMGRPAVLEAVKKFANGTNEELTVEGLRTLLIGTDKNANEATRNLLKQWWNEITEPDFIIGVPQKNESGGWTCALRNFGTGEVAVPVVAVTEKGETLTVMASIPSSQSLSRGISSVEFKTESAVVRVEVDPEKLYPQAKYEDKNSTQFDNDARPVRPYSFTLFREADRLFEQKDYAGAETKLRDALAQDPEYASSRVLLARVLLALGKLEAAQDEAAKALKVSPPPLYVLGWGAVVQGDIAVARKDLKAALAAYRRAVSTDAEIACNLAARKGVLESETAMQQVSQPDESVKGFIVQLDKAIKVGTSAAMESVVIKADLPQLVKRMGAFKPDSWTTQVLRSEVLDAQHIALDVKVDVITADKKVEKGSAVFILRRTASGWMLARIDLFTVQ